MSEESDPSDHFRACAARVIGAEHRDLGALARKHASADGALGDAFFCAAEAHYEKRLRRLAERTYEPAARAHGRDVREHAQAHLAKSLELLFALRGDVRPAAELLIVWRDRRMMRSAA